MLLDPNLDPNSERPYDIKEEKTTLCRASYSGVRKGTQCPATVNLGYETCTTHPRNAYCKDTLSNIVKYRSSKSMNYFDEEEIVVLQNKKTVEEKLKDIVDHSYINYLRLQAKRAKLEVTGGLEVTQVIDGNKGKFSYFEETKTSVLPRLDVAIDKELSGLVKAAKLLTDLTKEVVEDPTEKINDFLASETIET